MVVLFSTTVGKGCFARPSSSVVYSPSNQLFDATKRYRLLCKVYGIVVEYTHFSVSFRNAHSIDSRQNINRLVECSLCRLHSRYIEDMLSPYSSSVGTALPVLSQGGSKNSDQTNCINECFC